jgi:hypothetical protein
MGVLLLSVGTCVLPAQPTTHSCCMHMSMPCESKASCCVATSHIPPAMVTPAFQHFAAIEAVQAVLPAPGHSISRDALASGFLTPQSPPPRNFILRI